MKLTYKINVIALGVMVAVGLAISAAGLNAISEVTYRFNREVMAREVQNVVTMIEGAHGILEENRLDTVASYKHQAQSDVLAELEDYQFGETGQLAIITRSGKVVKHDTLATGQDVDITGAAEMISRQIGNMAFEYNGHKRFFSFQSFPDWDWVVILSISSKEVLAVRTQFLDKVVMILLISLCMGTLVVVWFTKRVVGPIRQLATATTYVSEGKWDAPLPKPAGQDEVALLTSAFRQMAAKLADMYGNLNRNLEQIARSEKALRHSEQRYRSAQEFLNTILNNVADPIFVKDQQHRWVHLNNAFCQLIGHPVDQLIGKTEYDFFPKEEADVFWQTDDLVFASGMPNENEEKITDASGQQHLILTKKAVFLDANEQPLLVGISKDITDRKKFEQELIKIEKLKSIGILAGGVAHDFNNLLMGIQGRVSLIQENMDPSFPHGDDLKAIEEYTCSASNLTAQLLGLAKGGKYEVKPLDINELIRDSSDMFGRTRKEIVIHARFNQPESVVEADRRQLEQVLLNVYVNAWQAMPNGGELHIETNILTLDTAFCALHQIESGEYVHISVTDTGMGMDETTRQRIFDPFFTTKEKSRGTGLGLASAFGIIKNHGGLITVDSKINQGTTFNIYLPLSDKAAVRKTKPSTLPLKGSGSILLVDDEEIVLEVGQEMLSALGYNVTAVNGGEKAVNAITSMGNEVDLIILDMVMPGMDGSTTFDHIRKQQPGIPIILSSGYSMDGQAEKIMRRGCNGFIQKPFNLSTISQKIRAVLDTANQAG